MSFVTETRQNIRSAGRRDYVGGSRSDLPLPRVGYLRAIHIHITGNMQVTPGTGTATLSEKAPWNLINRLRYQIGSATEVVNTSGWGAYLVELHKRLSYRPETGSRANLPATAFAGQVYAASATAGANAWEFGLTIPIVPNERDEVGLILLQAEGTVTQLLMEWQNAGGPTAEFPIVTTGNATAAFTGYADVYLETFTVPASVNDQPLLNRIHQITERTDNIFSTGTISVKLLNENVYLRLIHSVEINGALNTDAVVSRKFRYNVTDTPYELGRKMDLQLARGSWAKDFPKGVYHWDFFDQGYPNFGSDRDLVQAAGLAEVESMFEIDPTTTLGSGNNVIRTVQQQLVNVNVPLTAV